MKDLLTSWNSVKAGIRGHYLYLFLDCDGTLAPIAPTPEEARIPRKTIDALASLAKLKRQRIAIISGRPLAEIKSMIGLDGIIYVGNHGLEVDSPNITTRWKPSASYKNSLAEIKKVLEKEFASVRGVFVEDKDLSLCLHYRNAAIDEEKADAVFQKATENYQAAGKISVLKGKKVIEIRPALGFNKAKAVKWLLARERLTREDNGIVAMYIGDDESDEQAFKVLGRDDISVLVGKSADSHAAYFVNSTEDVYQVLIMLAGLRSG